MPGIVLTVEDDPLQREMLAILLRRLGYEVRAAVDGRSALALLQDDAGDDVALAILDVGLPGMDGLEILQLIKQRRPALPVIMLTGNQEPETVVSAMRLGAHDFMHKPVERERLQVACANALKTTLLEKEVARLTRTAKGEFTFENLIGYDGGLADVVRLGRKAAGTDIPVLLTGETGTGKEVFARAIHGESARGGKPFVAVNCGALPSQLVESILFGHEKGAFTGAVARAIGRFREAEGGTIFLDEIGDLPLDAQVKLLRVLQQKEVTPVGGDHAVPVNVRVLSATHRDLATEVAAGRFREDLYFRLNVLSVKLPSLAERAQDIPALVRHFVGRFAATESRPVKTVAAQAMDMLVKHRWSGNVRELENAIHRAMVMADGDVLRVDDFSTSPVDVIGTGAGVVPVSGAVCFAGPDGAPMKLADVERACLQFALLYHHGNVTRAAQSLGLAKSTFYRKLKEMGLDV